LSEQAPAGRGDAVVAPAALARLLDPASLNEPPRLHLIKERVERRGVKREDAPRALLDQLRDFVAMAGALLEQREHQHFSAPLLEGRIRRCGSSHMYGAYISAACVSRRWSAHALGFGLRRSRFGPSCTALGADLAHP